MARESAQSSYQRGVMSLLILALLDGEDMYGYQIVQAISDYSSGKIVTQEGSLYPVLYKLQEQGLISDKKVLVGKRMTRVYYLLTERGRQYCDTLLEDYQSIQTGVQLILEHRGTER